MAPFGRPVVPEVKRMSERESPVSAARRASTVDAGVSSARARN